MAVYRKKLVDKDGNTIIPAVGDIYGTVYDATLSSATAGGRADYEFTPDTPVENNKVYAVKFPAPTVNNATIILGDGVSSGSILVPPVAATDAPNYELLNTDMINDTEPLLLMYNGVQWVCLNQKKKVATADLENNSVTSDKVDWTTFIDKIYPVGSIYMSVNNVSPQSFIGGTWVAWGAGRVPVGVDPNDTSFDTAEEKGGEKTHTLTVSEIPSHNHGAYYTGSSALKKGYGWFDRAGNAMAYDVVPNGGGGAHNNLQPFITCYMWKRTA